MNSKDDVEISKFLSLVLRHAPETIGIVLDSGGWTDVATLIEKASKAGKRLSLEQLKHIVETNPKKRFAFNESMDKIRANQGHSVEVELGYEPQTPPEVLYHGTGTKSVSLIYKSGLQKQNRHHVHLSADVGTAFKVGQRHGAPYILEVAAGQMHNDGFTFFLSENGVWLTDSVPVKYLKEYKS